MADEFLDITIGALDEAECYRRSGGFLERVYFLSPDPTEQWEALFRLLWDQVEFFPKRHARIENHRLVFVCLEHELQGEQMVELIETFVRTNAAYRKALAGPGA